MNREFFVQSAPQLGHCFKSDRVLQSWLRRHLPEPLLAQETPWLNHLGELAGGELFALQQSDRLSEPRLTHYDPWGQRIDRIELTALWQRCRRLAASEGLVARGYESALGRWARPLQFAGVYLFHASSDVYTCPLAMTDGAARVLTESGNDALCQRALPRLLSRDPDAAWTSGQWMTEATGGSDLGGTETVARRQGEHWRLYGKKWFTSAATSEMALTLARPEGERQLALFYLETRDADGRYQGIELLRLKDKLGTRKVPTAELLLNGARATPVDGLDGGIRKIAPMLNVTRCWNSVCAIASMQRGIALARDYAHRRVARGRALIELPLHASTLAGLQARFEAAFGLVFFQLGLMGQRDAGELDADGRTLLRLVTPLSKLLTGKQAVAVASEVVECFGGAGYVEDAGVALLLRDAQVLPIWEGTTNVLSLDVLRVLDSSDAGRLLCEQIDRLLSAIDRGPLASEAAAARVALQRLQGRLANMADESSEQREAGARDLALWMARLLAFALLAEHAVSELRSEDDRPLAAARWYWAHAFSRPGADGRADLGDAQRLAGDVL